MSAIHPVPAQRPSLAYFAFVPEGNLKGIRIVRLKARTFTKTIENPLRERTVITVEMMSARGADDLCLSPKKPTRSVVFVSAIRGRRLCRW
jgi:hypothetical protein